MEHGFRQRYKYDRVRNSDVVASGEALDSPSIENGLKYLQATQNDDGGFTYAPDSPFGTDSDSNSSTYATQAILAVGQDPQSDT